MIGEWWRGLWTPASDGTPHLARHRQDLTDFLARLDDDLERAGAEAIAATVEVAARPSSDAERADRLERVVLYLLRKEEWTRALPLVSEVVEARRHARPYEPELLALALGALGMVQFALAQADAADESFAAHLNAWREALAGRPIELALKLENAARSVLEPWGRRRWAIEVWREAVALRRATVHQAPKTRGRFAAALQQLAMLEMQVQEYEVAESHLAQGIRLLRGEASRDPVNEQLRAGLVQMLVVQAALAGRRAAWPRADMLLGRAEGLTFGEPLLAAEMRCLVLDGRSAYDELRGDLAGAIAAVEEVLHIRLETPDLVRPGTSDEWLVTDTMQRLGELMLANDQPKLAREWLERARQIAGDSERLLLSLSHLEATHGDPVDAESLYRGALRLRKEQAAEIHLLFATSRAPIDGSGPPSRPRFGHRPANRLSFGAAHVLVPGGMYSDTSWLQQPIASPLDVGRATDPSRLLLRSLEDHDAPRFDAAVRRAAPGRLHGESALVFVHGFNVAFDEAVQRGAQLARDLNFDGPLVVFSWPSHASLRRYAADRRHADRSADHLADLMARLAGLTPGMRVHVLAHSMGNRVMLQAVRTLLRRAPGLVSGLGELVMAAPAVPVPECTAWLDEIAAAGRVQVTLYGARNDKAMWAGRWADRGVLAGHAAGGRPFTHPLVDSIDITNAATDDWRGLRHDIFAANPVMTDDIRQLLQHGRTKAPERRVPALRPVEDGQVRYWKYVAAAAAGTSQA